VLAGIGVVLPAWGGAVRISLSTVIVAINAQTLRDLDLRAEGETQTTLRPAGM
jgi:Cu2+-exporting ATPase